MHYGCGAQHSIQQRMLRTAHSMRQTGRTGKAAVYLSLNLRFREHNVADGDELLGLLPLLEGHTLAHRLLELELAHLRRISLPYMPVAPRPSALTRTILEITREIRDPCVRRWRNHCCHRWLQLARQICFGHAEPSHHSMR